LCYQHIAKASLSNVPNGTNFLTNPSLCSLFQIFSRPPLQNSRTFSVFQKVKKSGDPVLDGKKVLRVFTAPKGHPVTKNYS